MSVMNTSLLTKLQTSSHQHTTTTMSATTKSEPFLLINYFYVCHAIHFIPWISMRWLSPLHHQKLLKIGHLEKSPNQKLSTTELKNLKKLGFLPRKFLDLQKIGNAIVESIRKFDIKALFVTSVA